jgi:hypothetical protein
MADLHASRPEPDLVRPFLMTQGRTRPSTPALRVETLVETAVGADLGRLVFEHRSIAHLCADPHSIAEISARLRIPLGVVRVLVADLHDGGVLAVHEARGEIGLDVIDRIIRRVEAL